jgi:hypothetical protein
MCFKNNLFIYLYIYIYIFCRLITVLYPYNPDPNPQNLLFFCSFRVLPNSTPLSSQEKKMSQLAVPRSESTHQRLYEFARTALVRSLPTPTPRCASCSVEEDWTLTSGTMPKSATTWESGTQFFFFFFNVHLSFGLVFICEYFNGLLVFVLIALLL